MFFQRFFIIFMQVKWASEHRDELNTTSQLVVSGESGGGNLSIAAALLAKERGLTALTGLHALCPFIGLYHQVEIGILERVRWFICRRSSVGVWRCQWVHHQREERGHVRRIHCRYERTCVLSAFFLASIKPCASILCTSSRMLENKTNKKASVKVVTSNIT